MRLKRFLDDRPASVESISTGRRHSSGNFLEHRGDVSLFVFADDGAAQVEHVRGRGLTKRLGGWRGSRHSFWRADEITKVLKPRRGIHLFGDDQRFGIEVERKPSL